MPTDRRATALLIIDMINTLDFDGGHALLEQALPAAERISRLKRRARQAGVPVIYANDNYGRWRSDFRQVVELCSRDDSLGAPLARALRPDQDDFFVLKPKNSAFHRTPLQLLLADLGTRRLILTGTATDSCVLATAADANMHDMEVWVPSDCVAAQSAERSQRTLELLRQSMHVETRPSNRIRRAMLEE